MTDETRSPMSAQARYVAAILNGLNADDVANLVAEPPGNRAKELGYVQLDVMVNQHATDDDKARWTELLIAAASVPRREGWSSTWATPLAKLLGICVDPPRVEASQVRPRAAKAAEVHANGQAAGVA